MAILNAWINGFYGGDRTEALIRDLVLGGGVEASKMFMNGETSYNFFICRNHRGPVFERFFQFLHELLKVETQELYGVIYLYDDEDKACFDTYQLWTVRKGEIVVEQDTLLSPFSQKVAFYGED